MSIAHPKTMADVRRKREDHRAKMRRTRVEEIVRAALDVAKPPEPDEPGYLTKAAIVRTGAKRAVCHPKRYAVKGGLCRGCLTKQVLRHEKTALTPEQALAKVVNTGEDRVAKAIRAYLQLNLEEYARLHIEATRIAALKGDGRPAEWALQSVKVGEGPIVSPPAKDGSGGGGGVKVLIGVQLGGLPAGPSSVSVTPTASFDTNAPEPD